MQTRKISRQRVPSEILELEKQGGEFFINAQVVARRQKKSFLRKDCPYLVKLYFSYLMNAATQSSRGQASVGNALLNGQLHPGMKQHPPAANQCVAGLHFQQLLRIRLGNEDDFIGKILVRGQTYFFALHDAQQFSAIDDVSLAMRNSKSESCQLAILFNYPSEYSG